MIVFEKGDVGFRSRACGPIRVPVSTMENEHFVEIEGPDGRKHHVGPFKTRTEAEAWIVWLSAHDARRSGAVSHVDNNITEFQRNDRKHPREEA
jgi:hypothetical protein